MIFAADAVISMVCNILQLNQGFLLSVLTMMYACPYGADAMYEFLRTIMLREVKSFVRA
jgi:hypothetical protein